MSELHEWLKNADPIQEKKLAKAQAILLYRQRVPLTNLLKYTKKGEVNTSSTVGKVAKAALTAGWEVRAGKSDYQVGDDLKHYEWIDCVNNRTLISVQGATVVLNRKHVITVDRALELINA